MYLIPAHILILFALLFVSPAYAGQQNHDFSGIYQCVGKDKSEGSYRGTVRIKRVPEHSKELFSAYSFELEVADYGKYPGFAVGNGHQLAIYFAHTAHQSNQDFGIGIANFKKNNQGKWSFQKFYYEPAFKGGNHGFENCLQQ